MALQLRLEVDQRLEKLQVNSFNALNGLVVDDLGQVFLSDLVAQLLRPEHPIEALTLLQGRLVHVALLSDGESEDKVE